MDFNDFVSEVASLIKHQRVKKKISRKKIANDLGLKSVQSLANIEQGRALVPYKHIPYFCAKLDIDRSIFLAERIKYVTYLVTREFDEETRGTLAGKYAGLGANLVDKNEEY